MTILQHIEHRGEKKRTYDTRIIAIRYDLQHCKWYCSTVQHVAVLLSVFSPVTYCKIHAVFGTVFTTCLPFHLQDSCLRPTRSDSFPSWSINPGKRWQPHYQSCWRQAKPGGRWNGCRLFLSVGTTHFAPHKTVLIDCTVQTVERHGISETPRNGWHYT